VEDGRLEETRLDQGSQDLPSERGQKNPKSGQKGQFEAQKGAKKGKFRQTTFYSKKINQFTN
jgi:hypothetical protein